MPHWPSKDPNEVLDFTWQIPLDDGDVVSSASLTKVSGSAVIDSQTRDGALLTAFISGGTDGEVNEFQGRATTAAGRMFEDTIFLPITASNASTPLGGGFIAAFPAFAAVPEASIAYWATQAALITDPIETCLGARYQLATWLITAHYLVQQGLGTGAEAQAAAQGSTGYSRIKSGSLELERATNDGAAKMGDWGTTSYGMRVYPMLKACFGGPRVSASGYLPGCGFTPPWS